MALSIENLQEFSCSSYMDYTKRLCPIYDTQTCSTPDQPVLCPLLDNVPRSPCRRWICSSIERLSSTSTVPTVSSTLPRSYAQLFFETSTQSQVVNLLFFFCFLYFTVVH